MWDKSEIWHTDAVAACLHIGVTNVGTDFTQIDVS